MYDGITMRGVKAQCPFYEHETKKGIVCEGIIEKTQIETRFKTEQEKIEHIKDFCFFASNGCPIYIALYDNYPPE